MSLILDSRDKNDIFMHLLSLARYYVPEWNTESSGNDLGLALLEIYSEMFAETLTRFNKILNKNFIYFLNLIGAEMLPCSPSEGYLTVNAAAGQSALIRKGTRAYATGENSEKIMFMLCGDLPVIENKITDIFCRSGNTIVHGMTDNEIKLFDFSGENLQRQSIILSSDNVLNIRGGALVSVSLENTVRPFKQDDAVLTLSDPRLSKWQYLTPDGWLTIAATSYAGNKLNLYSSEGIPLTEYNGIEGRWLRCVIENDAGSEVCLTDVRISTQAENIMPDCLYDNDLHLPDNGFLPFGERFARFDSFYIGCEEAFTKKGAQILIELSLSLTEMPVNMANRQEIRWKPIIPASELNEQKAHIYIEDVAWEYWNGSGWIRLFADGAHSGVFRRGVNETISFECPEDMEQAFIGGNRSRFIRARILKQSDIFMLDSYYCAPVVNGIRISYSYRDEGPPVDFMFAERDLSITAADRRTEIRVNGEYEKSPTAYIALENPLPKGVFKIYFRNLTNLENPPSVKFEYYGETHGEHGWFELKTLDETKSFSVSGLNTFILGSGLEGKRLKLFSLDKYWIRAVNTDGGYENPGIMRPRLSGIYFNTVKLKQLEAKEPEYFSIGHGEINKTCQLGGRNIVDEEVWVNELSETPDYELISNGGTPDKWVKWSRAERLGDKGPGDRVYILDPIEGSITFGSGKKGKIPPSGDDETIRVEYSVCLGSSGNLDAYKIEGFADSVPFITEIYNAEPISGGCDTESAEDAVSRCSKLIGHLNCAVSIRDFEIIAAADRNVVRAKALLTEKGVTVAVLPRHINSTDISSLKKRVMVELARKAPAVLANAGKINVTEACYIEFSVWVRAAVSDLRDWQGARRELEKRLEEFFQPVTGSFDGKGFEIGVLPTKVQIINFLKGAKIARIDRLDIFCRERVNGGVREVDFEKAVKNPFAVPVSGEHEIIITE